MDFNYIFLKKSKWHFKIGNFKIGAYETIIQKKNWNVILAENSVFPKITLI